MSAVRDAMSIHMHPRTLALRPLLRALSCCAEASEALRAVTAPQPGTVSEYHQHLLLQLPSQSVAAPSGAQHAAAGMLWWPPLIEK